MSNARGDDLNPFPAPSSSAGLVSRRKLLWAGSAAVTVGPFLGCDSKKRAFAPVEGATSAERAVNAARRFSGMTLNVGWETGDQAQDPLRFSGPLWERLTGIRINVVELGIPIDL